MQSNNAWKSWNVGLNSLKAAVYPLGLALIFLSTCFCVDLLAAQERTFASRLAVHEGVFLWTDDADELLEASYSLLEGCEFPRKGRERIDNSASATAETIDQVLEVIDSLDDAHLFDGEVGLIWLLRKYETVLTGPILIARTNKSERQIEPVMQSFSIRFRDGRDRSISLSKDPVWSLDGEWLCCCSSHHFEDAKGLLNEIEREANHENGLTSERDFQRAMNLESVVKSKSASVDFFVSPLALNLYSSWMKEVDGNLYRFLNHERWKTAYLHELKGLGGRVKIELDQDAERRLGPVQLEAHLINTRPRHGLIRALDTDKSNTIKLDMPALQAPISKLFQVAIDGEQALKGGREMERAAVALKYSWPESIPMYLLPIEQAGSVEFIYPRESEPDLKLYSTASLTVLRVRDRDEFGRLIGGSSTRFSVARLSSLPKPWSELGTAPETVWVYSDERLEQLKQRIKDDLRDFESSLEEIEEREFQTEQSREFVKKGRARLEEMTLMAASLHSRQEPFLFQLSDWIWYQGYQPSIPELAITEANDSHSQLQLLTDHLQELQSQFRLSHAPSGVYAIWPDHLLKRTLTDRYFANRANVEEDVSSGSESSLGIEFETCRSALEQVIADQCESLVLSIYVEEGGIRFYGGAFGKASEVELSR